MTCIGVFFKIIIVLRFSPIPLNIRRTLKAGHVSQMLLGMYRCTDIPGKFVWQPGTLTQAVTKGQWILLEDIDHAPLDVVGSNKL